MLGDRIHEFRLKAGLAQIHLADRLGTTQKTIANWESGKREPKISELIRLADVFKITLDELVGREAELS